MRDAQGGYAGQEIRVNDTISSNNGGAVFVDRMRVGDTSPGQFAHQRGLTQVGSTLQLGAPNGNDGTLIVSGGSMRGGHLAAGGEGANGLAQVVGGVLTVDDLNMPGSTGASIASAVRVTGGLFEVAGFGTLGTSAGNSAAQLVVDGGRMNGGGKITLNRMPAGAGPSLLVSTGTAAL